MSQFPQMNALPTAEAKLAVTTGHANKPASKAGVTQAKNCCNLQQNLISTHVK
jgi:hypothetical protein